MSISNADRADMARSAIEEFRREAGLHSEGFVTLLGDLLCNLRHLARQEGYDFDVINELAGNMFRQELKEDE